MFRANNFDKLLDKATSNLRLDPDWPTILQICDLIRQNDCSPKYAVTAVKKKLYSSNPHQAMFALLTLESIVKNCGSGVHDEVTSKAFCEMLRDLVKTTQHENLRNKILELIQAWAFAFRNSPKYRAVQDTVNILKAECYKFPPLKESDAMFSADTAPEWADGEVCHRCRVAFSLMVRRHHCRACGQVFCQQCSAKQSTLPKFGIEKEVRVCDACYDKVSRPPPSSSKLEIVDTSSDYGPAAQPQKRTGGKTAEELQEEEELQLALALSQSEAEQKEKERKSRSHIAPDPAPLHPTLSPTPSSVSASPEHSTQANSELSRYLDRNYWEQRISRDNTVAPTAPAPASHASDTTEEFPKPSTTKAQDDDAEDKEIDEFVETLKSQVEIFVNRMKSNSSRGRSIANDTAVQTLFMNITAMHSRLLRYIQQQDDKRVYLESLQDKVTQIRDSRAALDTLRAEHTARVAAAAEAAERQRQMQMAAKLQAMRKKKHEYLQYQRQLALQRVQEQEREMQMRQEQQKHQYLMNANNFYMPGVSLQQQFPSGYPNQPIYGNPQFHPQMMPQATTDSNVPGPVPGQAQISTANMPMNINPMATIQSMPQLTNTFAALSTSAGPVNQTSVSAQQSMAQSNLRPNLSQQLPIQQQMMLQQMHQMRMPVQSGMHQIGPQAIANGMPGQNIPQQNGQNAQLPKQNLPNQPQQQPNAMMPPMSVGQQNINQQNMGQPLMNTGNPMLGLQMQNMRMPLMQGNQPNPNQQIPVSGYQNMNIPNQVNTQQPGSQAPNIQAQSQMPMPGQQMPMQGQQMMQGQTIPGQPQMQMNNNMPQVGQNLPPGPGQQVPQTQAQQMPPQHHQQQMPLNQAMTMPGQGMQQPGQQMQMMQGQQIQSQGPMMNPGQNPQGQIPGPQQVNQGQIPTSLPNQQMMQGQIQAGNPGQIPMGHQMQMGPVQQMQQGPPMQGQIPQQMGIPQQMQAQLQQGQPAQNIPGQQKMQQPNVPQGQLPQQGTNQQAQSPGKPEHNNNTGELISFD
ncbi:hepatocyte growth factor-regulated tyrosine kinase substrate-like [Helicoverpa zea]|uniref:hepatocyte growth factor-regulated tyrosine kinase substrate-like n=1 Tax=Helicoverpa zea TaxID=7113 RepID=UPI001F5A38E6|nr:hepatocyte growth factor-regulated tyrosine kinase substrate-like [Helicoverpa zea]